MDCTLTYWTKDPEEGLRSLRLTVLSGDEAGGLGLAALRRRRLMRLVGEARTQGARLTYSDLSVIMLASRATLKRDVIYLRQLGNEVPIGREALGSYG